MGFVLTLVIKFTAHPLLYPGSLNGEDEEDRKKSPRSSPPRSGLETKAPQSNNGGGRCAVTTHRDGREVYRTTLARLRAVQGEINFDADKMGS